MHDRGLGSWMARRRLASPDATALIHGGGNRTSYRHLADRVERVSAVLSGGGVSPGDRVAYLGENSPDFLATLFACARIGAVFVPVNTRLAAPEVGHILRDSGARLVVHDPEFAVLTRQAASADGRPPAISTAARGDDGLPGLAALLDGIETVPPPWPGDLDDPAAIIYTSGTTGRAKGAVLTHGNLTWASLNSIVDYDIVASDVALMISPLFHVASLGMGALPALLTGATIVLEKGFEAGHALELIERHAVTLLSGVPTTFQLMADHPRWSATDLSSLRTLTCGGSAAPIRILNAYEERGLHFSQGYGMTETSPGVTSLPPSMTRAKQGSVGLPHAFTSIRITDSAGRIVAGGTVGEIEVAGPNVFAGYHAHPEATAAAFTEDGWFRSGDLGYVDDDGYLYIAGRAKDMIISGGENIYPAEVESLIADIDGVARVAVIGVADDAWGEVPWAILTVVEGAEIDTSEVRRHLEGRIARYKLPKRIVVVDDLPLTASGKVRKDELRARFA